MVLKSKSRAILILMALAIIIAIVIAFSRYNSTVYNEDMIIFTDTIKSEKENNSNYSEQEILNMYNF